MKQSTLNNIKQAVNQLIKNNIKLTTEVLSKEAHTSKRTVTEFFKMFPKESFNKYYKNGTANNSTILKQDTQSGTDSNMENGTIQIGTEEHFDVMTEEGYVNQLNKLYSKGSVDKEYYIEQVRILKNNYPISSKLIKEKLLMN
jgi:hypothetical protein